MMPYILKSSLCIAAFYLFYMLFLERENMHAFKRYYLLGSLLLAFCIPLISIPYTEALATSPQNNLQEIPLTFHTEQVQETAYHLPAILWSIYGLGVLAFGIIFLKNLFRMRYIIKCNTKIKMQKCIHVLVQKPILPHTFFNYVFLNKYQFKTQQIPKEVLWHEEAHALQKHSVDIVFIEALQVLLWFNPLIYIVKHAIKLNHEFLADRAVILRGATTSTYQNMLLAFSSHAKQYPLANAIHYSLIKKRFTVMKKQTSKRTVWLRSLLLLPLLSLLIYSFSTKVKVSRENHHMGTLKEWVPNGNDIALDGVYLQQADATDEHLKIFINRNGTVLINNQKTTVKGLKNKLKNFNRTLSLKERQKRIKVMLYADPDTKMRMISDVKETLRNYGISKISLNMTPPPPLPPVAALVEVEEVQELEEVEVPEVIELEEVQELEEVEIPKVIELEEVQELEEVEIPKVIEVKVPEIVNIKEVEEVIVEEMDEIPPPPPPISPTDHIIAMAEQGAVFYHNGKKITSDVAITLTKRRKKLHILTKHKNTKQPIVQLSDTPIVVKQ